MTASHLLSDNSQDHDELAGLWCVRMAEGALNDEETRAFQEWLSSSPDNQAKFEYAVAMWDAIKDYATDPELIMCRQRALGSYRKTQILRWGLNRNTRKMWLGIAASIVLCIGGLLWHLQQPIAYQTGVGERRIVLLKDGSHLSLDADTKVLVRYSMKRRDLTLVSGRASFTVAHDASRPFSVVTGENVVIATGTAFSVERLANQVRIILYEGHVKLLKNAEGHRTPIMASAETGETQFADRLLLPGKQIVLDAPPDGTSLSLRATLARVEPAEGMSSNAWEEGQLEFVNEPLNLAVERVNRYSSKLHIVTTAEAANVRISGVFAAGDTETFIAGVVGAFPVEQLREKNQVILVKREAPKPKKSN